MADFQSSGNIKSALCTGGTISSHNGFNSRVPLCPRAHGLFPLPQPVLATNTFCVQASSQAVQKKSPERGRVYRRRTGRGDSVQDSGSSEYHRSSHLCSSKHRSIAVSMNPCRTPFETPANRQPGKFAAAPNRVQTVHNDLDQKQ